MPKTAAAVPADRAEAVELLTRALSAGHSITLSLAVPPRVIRAPPLVTACCLTFGLTPSEARVLLALVEHGFVGKADLHGAMSREDKVVTSRINTLGVVVYRLRAKLAEHGIAIETVWGQGFKLDEAARDRLRKILAEYGADTATPSEPEASP